MKVGDKVLYNNKIGSVIAAEITKYNFKIAFNKNVCEIKKDNGSFQNVFTENLTVIEEFVEKNNINKDELLDIINQDKSAEEILLDLLDHLTN